MNMNYTNNNNQFNNYQNENYFNQKTQNNLQAMYRNSSNFSNNTSYSNNKYKLHYSNADNYQKKRNGKQKSVKFNEKVNIIKIESYKQYNKIDDDINLDNIINNGHKQRINIDKKKGDNCECILI